MIINENDSLIAEVAQMLGVEFDTVKWDMSRLSIIEKLVLIIRASALEVQEREDYIKYITGFPFRGGFSRGSAEKES